MKTLNMFSWNFMAKSFLSTILLATIGCDDNNGQEYISIDSASDEREWVNFIEDLSYESIVLVADKNELNDALQQVSEGDLIFFEENGSGGSQDPQSTEGELLAVSGLDEGQITIKDLSDNKAKLKSSGTESKGKGQYRRSCRILEIKRSMLSDDIAHYQILVRLGSGPYDIVRIHRVVKETRRYRPVRTSGNIFMVHGSSQDFDDIFLRPGVDSPNEQNSSPYFLASQNIDVWGIDLGWTLVPLETTDLSSFQDWGTTKDTRHVMKSMAIARLVRGLTRQGFGRMNLLGFSYGGNLAYSAAFKETQQHPILRDIKGIIPTDWAMLFAPEDDEYRENICNNGRAAEVNYSNGVYQTSNGVAFAAVGGAALSDPMGDSPFAPGFTNYQFAIAAAALPGPSPQAPSWHFLGGEFDGQTPTGLLYTDTERWFKLLVSLAPHQPTYNAVEGFGKFCEENVATIENQLGELRIPILYIGAAGGFGEQGVYSTTRTNSKDVSIHIVSKQPEELRAIDYGHADIFMADDAAQMVWEPLRDWLISHK
ncbi:hypothetical protein FVB32_08370 [Flagellimonas hymeniacidonis]|uniref:Uncharacterized protein n=1 Tax=Flagellimonas hymeniacidonis TaxID=2603628 RepID=A0A5C8V8L7_9FLAO|nr:hypothetical protein [Flagellimonas hymeniacidonis]TXN38295.1 hypothetical protein FVB32_08370 [Flagellimonas hymeniacidonis]